MQVGIEQRQVPDVGTRPVDEPEKADPLHPALCRSLIACDLISEVGDGMPLTVEYATERHLQSFVRVLCRSIEPDQIELTGRVAGQIDILHEPEVLVPIVLIQADCVHLLGCVNQIGVPRRTATTTIGP